MKISIAVMLGALVLVACSKDPQAESIGTTTIRRADDQARSAVSVDEVRAVLLERRPDAVKTINGLLIKSEGGIVTLSGTLADGTLRSDLINRVRAMPSVRGVRDELRLRAQ